VGRTITKTPQAHSDLLDLAGYIARDSLDAAERFLDAPKLPFAC
jgi:plasmid stabilization system protein ParE